MKKIISLISILCLTALMLCACGKKGDKDANSSKNTASQESVAENIDEVVMNEIDEDELPVQGDIGDTPTTSSNKNNASSSSKTNSSTGSSSSASTASSGSVTSSTASSSGSASSVASSESSSNASSNSSTATESDASRETMTGYSPWQ